MKRLISNILRIGVIAVIAAVLFVPSAASAQYSEETTTTVDSNVGGGGVDNGGGTGVSGGGLPRTGSSNTVPLVTIGSMLLVGGALLVFGVRRQRANA